MDSRTAVPTLVDGAVRLRPMEPDDRDAVLAAASDGELWNLFFTNVPGPDTIDRYLATAVEDRSRGRAVP